MRTLLIAAAVLTILAAVPAAAQQGARGNHGGAQRMSLPRMPSVGQPAPRTGFTQNFGRGNGNATSTSRSFSRSSSNAISNSQTVSNSSANAVSNTRVVVRGSQHGINNGQWATQRGHGRFSGPNQTRWGNRIGGRWYAGVDAPGGWKAYRRPVRGWQLPRYWTAPSFTIFDYGNYGLGAPNPGYLWTRYYDDALLIDEGGRVYDSVSGIDWDGGYREDRYASDGYIGDAGAPGPSYEPDERHDEPDSSVGVPVAGGVVDDKEKLARVVDRREDHSEETRDVRREEYVDSRPDHTEHRGRVDRRVIYAQPREIVQARHHARSDHSRGYGTHTTVVGGSTYYTAPGTTTVITIQPAVTTTTTTTEYVTEAYRVPSKRVYRVKRRVCACK